ncbi:nitrate- and nitrite sensing domain-containing protein [Streptomyces sp. DT171]|uniref:sensor histidine kinase n=1 Tax=Streptomyces sp. DT171 TaxID=3416524 RepID=UPI003CEF00C1
MQKKRPRSKGTEHDGSGAVPVAPETGGRTVRVRTRLVAGVAVVGVIVIAAGAPAALGASSDLTESQRLVTLAELNQQAVVLAHSLADERDDVTAYIAAGRDEEAKNDKENGPGSGSARVDQQIDEIDAAAPAALRRDLSTVPALRRDALSGKGSALEAHQAYTEVIAKLQGLADELADKTPPRATADTRAPLALGRAVEQASATRGLLLAALSVQGKNTGNTGNSGSDGNAGNSDTTDGTEVDPDTGLPVRTEDGNDDKADGGRTRDELSAAAQLARVRELAALGDFDQAADPAAREKLSSTVTGPEVNSADTYLSRLTDRPELSKADLKSSKKKVGAALSARIDRMRGVESALGAGQVQRLEQLRDDDVTALELRIALLGGCLLIAVAVSTAVARTLTQPLAVLRIGAGRLAADPRSAEPVRYTGRNDEFAQVVRSVNALHGKLRGLLDDVDTRSRNAHGEREALTAERDALAAERAELQAHTADLAARLEQLKNSVDHTFVNLSLRTLGLVERQLGVIEGLEEREQDPERLGTLFKLDHMATVMRRHSENMLVLAGAEHGHGHAGPIPLVDVARAAVSEIERYERVTIQSLPPHVQIAGFAADDLSHLVAELLENATAFSPPDSQVELSGWLLETGEVMLSVQDQGIGMSSVRMDELNARLADPASFEAGAESADGAGLGLQVASLLAARHGVRIQLREQKGSGVTVVVVLPQTLLPTATPPSVPTTGAAPKGGDSPTLNLPGSVAEANSNALPPRASIPSGDPLITAAERTLRESGNGAGTDEDTATAEEPASAGDLASADHPAEAGREDVENVEEAPAPGVDDVPGPTTADRAEKATTGVPPTAEATEREAETTMQVRVVPAPEAPGPYAIGPDRHERTPDIGSGTRSGARPEPSTGSIPDPSSVPAPTRPAPEPEATAPADAPAPAADTAPAADPTSPAASAPSDASAPVDAPGPAGPEPDGSEPDGGCVPGPRQPAGRVTDKGLPKRTPRIVAPAAASGTESAGVLDKEALRRRLGGFHQGAKDGRRDVEAEIAESTANTRIAEHGVRTAETEHTEPGGRTDGRADSRTEETGDTVEEARS